MVRESTDPPNKDKRDSLALVSEFSPAGDQPEAIAGLVEGLTDGLARDRPRRNIADMGVCRVC